MIARINDAEIAPGADGAELKDGGYAMIVEGVISPPSKFMSAWVSSYDNKSGIAGSSTYPGIRLHAHSVVLEPLDPNKVKLVNRCRQPVAS